MPFESQIMQLSTEQLDSLFEAAPASTPSADTLVVGKEPAEAGKPEPKITDTVVDTSEIPFYDPEVDGSLDGSDTKEPVEPKTKEPKTKKAEAAEPAEPKVSEPKAEEPTTAEQKEAINTVANCITWVNGPGSHQLLSFGVTNPIGRLGASGGVISARRASKNA